ncbi:acetylornithine deacetylase [Cognatishimia maritima]|uniref:Acetylornithine deacetylase n=1 Tax=Cognatishimia maritima TaxID=870908 RepID=A0A1M5Q861_9RHOB|nr:acetylornithine deacetylase [Cognatishimia maritima]SHH10096.1 acetylornithine deacetylase [Cognatishimia maritima]
MQADILSTARNILERLIAFPTVSDTSNLALVEYVDGYLRSHGVEPIRVSHGTEPKEAIYANIGPRKDGGVLLSGHTDVVPVKGQNWDRDPFQLTERDGKLFGRGSCDMKGFVALSLATVPYALKAGIARPLQIALSFDEEVGMTGAPIMLDHMQSSGFPKAEAVIVGEPTTMDLVTAHNGGFGYQVHVHGFEVHSSIMHKGVSAVMMAARLIEWANQMNDRASARDPSVPNAAFDPHYSTIHVGQISGGTALNITAKDCAFVIDFRIVPGDDFAELLQAFEAEVVRLDACMKAVRLEAGISIDRDFYAPGLMDEPDSTALKLARRLSSSQKERVVSFLTEAGLFQQHGYSTVVCGPGDIAQAHQPNEFISLDQFAKGAGFMAQLVECLTEVEGA